MAISIVPIDFQQKQRIREIQASQAFKKLRSLTSQEHRDLEFEDNYYGGYFQQELGFFVQEPNWERNENDETNPDPIWITDKMWVSLLSLNQLPVFKGIISSF